MELDWNINPLVFLEFGFVLAFGIGWFILERVVARHDRPKKSDDDNGKS